MKTKELKSFFCIADGMLSDIVKLDYFQESLLMNILFNDRVVLDGAYCFNSGGVREYMKASKGKKDSLLSYFSRNGTITPAIRNNNIEDMWTLFDSFVNIHYKDNPSTFPDLKKKINPYNQEFVSDINKGLETKKASYFDENSGLNKNYYLKMMEGLLHQNESEILSYVKNEPDYKWFKGVWRESEEWRYKCLEEASINSIKLDGTPLKRSMLFSSIGKRILGKEYSDETKSNVNFIMQKANKEQKKSLDAIVAITNHLQQIELAKRYDCTIEFPIYNKVSPIVLKDQYDEKSNEFKNLPRFKSTINLPSIESLLKIEAPILEEIKDKHFHLYKQSLIDYSNEPSSKKLRNKVKTKLNDYCNALCDAVNDSIIFEIDAKFDPVITTVIDYSIGSLITRLTNEDIATTVLGAGAYTIAINLVRKNLKKFNKGKPYSFDVSIPPNNISNL
ncbi:hypothetical protein [Flagellimonas myxillae]|uniref:hypothetical protein n=1 Tax=Flagellimonas myxillae TaxID=2942214 RepID=UPI00201F467B|nr:hypothetical protein [Muricauda myxillae]MCL6264919.1 hypothetical protein [Muricauda myxillae]